MTLVIRILCGGFVLAVLMAMAFDVYADFDESDYIPKYTEDCQYMHDVLNDKTPVEECAHVMAFWMSHYTEIDHNAHARKK
jgi:hypothetical protein